MERSCPQFNHGEDSFYLQEYFHLEQWWDLTAKFPVMLFSSLGTETILRMEVCKSRLGLGTSDVLPRLIKDYRECRPADRGPFNKPYAFIGVILLIFPIHLFISISFMPLR